MNSKWFRVFLVMVLVSLGEGCWDEERTALLQLKHFFPDSYGFLYDWVENAECCKWERVKCDNITDRVIKLDLFYISDWNLREWYLNVSLFSPFQQLHSLDLSYNNIAGCIENEGFEKVSKLSNFEKLNLGANRFNNSILSSLVSISSLKHLYLYANAFNEALNIKGLTRFSNLEVIDLSDNNFNNSILSSLGGLSSLKSLYLYDIGWNGSVDVQGLYSLKNLEKLDMGRNKIDKFVNSKDSRGLKKLNVLSLSGIKTTDASVFLQSTLRSFSSLKTLDISHINNLNGTVITQELHNLITLEELILDGLKLHIGYLQAIATSIPLKHLSMIDCELNGTSGPINFKNLESLFMDGNTFNTSFGQIIRPITTLKTLSLQNCELNGTLQDQGLCEMMHLEELYIDNNALQDTLPPCLANLTSLRVLRISNNLLQIPISLTPLYNLSKLKEFWGDNNQVYQDTMSPSLTPKFQLNFIILSSYGYGATFPRFLYHQHDLEEVYLSHIKLNGKFPNWLIENNTKLELLYLSNNSLSGPILLPIHRHMKLTTLDISINSFSGQIPIEVGAFFPMLMDLNISNNALNGSIPSSFGNMSSLQRLDLSSNQLSDEIPEQLGISCLSLEYLFLSNNSFEGPIFSKIINLTNLISLYLDNNNFIGSIL